MMSGLEHLAQKIGRIPNLKVDVPNGKDSDRARKKAEKRDDKCRHEGLAGRNTGAEHQQLGPPATHYGGFYQN